MTDQRLPDDLVDPIHTLRSLPTPDHQPMFWDALRRELEAESGVDGADGGRNPGWPTGLARLLVAAAVLVALVATAGWLAGDRSTRLDTIPAVDEDKGGDLDDNSAPLGPFDFMVHGVSADGRSVVATRSTGRESACYFSDGPGSGGNAVDQNAFVDEILLVDAVGGEQPEVVGEVLVDSDTWFTPSLLVGDDWFVSYSWCHPPAGLLTLGSVADIVVGDGEPMKVLELPTEFPLLTVPVRSGDGSSVLVTYLAPDGERIRDERELVTYDAATGEVVARERTEQTVLAELAGRIRLVATDDRMLQRDGEPLRSEYRSWFDTVRPSPNRRSVAVFGQSGLVVVGADSSTPRYERVTRETTAVAWLSDELLLVAIGGRPEPSTFELVRLVSDGEPEVTAVSLGLSAVHAETLTVLAEGRIAVSGFSAREPNATWIVDGSPESAGSESVSGIAAADDASVDPLEQLLPEGSDFGAGWTRSFVDLRAEGIELSDNCNGTVSTVLPPGIIAEYGFDGGVDDALVLVAADTPTAIDSLAADLGAILSCDAPEFEQRSIVVGDGTEASLAVYGRVAIFSVDDRLLLVATEEGDPEAVIRSVLDRLD